MEVIGPIVGIVVFLLVLDWFLKLQKRDPIRGGEYIGPLVLFRMFRRLF